MKAKLLIATIFTSGFMASNAVAGDEEHMEVTAPSECCQTYIPVSLGLLTGWVGASASAGPASLKDVALKASVDKAVKQKSKRDQKKEEEKTEYDKATDNKSNNDSLYREAGLTFRQLLDNGSKLKIRFTDEKPDGSKQTLEIEDCTPSGPLNPNKVTCTQQTFEQFTDPTDGVEKWAFTMAVVEAAYNPKHYDANSRGWYPKVVDNQTFTLVFETEADLMWQLNKVAGR